MPKRKTAADVCLCNGCGSPFMPFVGTGKKARHGTYEELMSTKVPWRKDVQQCKTCKHYVHADTCLLKNEVCRNCSFTLGVLIPNEAREHPHNNCSYCLKATTDSILAPTPNSTKCIALGCMAVQESGAFGTMCMDCHENFKAVHGNTCKMGACYRSCCSLCSCCSF